MIAAVDYIFSVCAATYGSAWDRSLGQAPIADTKTAWLLSVSPFKNSKKRVMWALENLPERCPNPVEFRSLCRAAPMPEMTALPEPKADPARVAAELAKLGHIKHADKPNGMKDWAYSLQARDKAGESLNSYQKSSYKAALGFAA